MWKRAGCQTESKAREKSIVAKTVRLAGFGAWKPFDID